MSGIEQTAETKATKNYALFPQHLHVPCVCPVKVTELFQTLCADPTFLSTPVGTWARDAFEHVIAALFKKLPKDQVRITYLMHAFRTSFEPCFATSTCCEVAKGTPSSYPLTHRLRKEIRKMTGWT